MGKYQKRTVMYCLLFVASSIFGQVAKTSLSYAPSAAYLAGFVFVILAAVNAVKAYREIG